MSENVKKSIVRVVAIVLVALMVGSCASALVYIL